jgi:carboxypeptidase Taq
MSDVLDGLKERLAEVQDLSKVVRLLSWDQQTMMPPAGTAHRAEQLSTVFRIAHEKFTDPEIGRLLDELKPLEDSLDPDSDDAALIRLTRRDYEKSVKVPAELRAATARPSLQRIVELKLEYVDCVADGAAERYDVLLDDYEPQTTTAEVRALFGELKPPLVELIAQLRERDVDDSFMHGDFPPERQVALAHEVTELFGHRPDSWRIDPTEHPFASGPGRDDVRITTNYHPDSLESLFSTMHEYGHGLYSHQQPKHLERLPTGGPCSLGIHESQSRLWENLVGRSLPFWRHFYPRVQAAYPEQLADVDLERFYAGVHKVKPDLIRIQADEVTYGMHVMLRFELEQDIVEGRVELRDLPQRWNEKMWDYLGVEVPDDGRGVLQDVHWSGGSIGYFSTYLIGTVASVQIWEAAGRDLPQLEEEVGRGDFAPLREWLGEHVHALGRKYSPQETLRRATGSPIAAQPYLDYLRATYA